MKNPRFKQDNPRDQIVATTSAIMGNALNLRKGVGDPKVIAERIINFADDIFEITKQHLGNTSWDEEE